MTTNQIENEINELGNCFTDCGLWITPRDSIQEAQANWQAHDTHKTFGFDSHEYWVASTDGTVLAGYDNLNDLLIALEENN